MRAGALAALRALVEALPEELRPDLLAFMDGQCPLPDVTPVAATLDAGEEEAVTREIHARILAAIEAARLRLEATATPPGGPPEKTAGKAALGAKARPGGEPGLNRRRPRRHDISGRLAFHARA